MEKEKGKKDYSEVKVGNQQPNPRNSRETRSTETSQTQEEIEQAELAKLRYRFGGVRYSLRGPSRYGGDTFVPKNVSFYTFPRQQ